MSDPGQRLGVAPGARLASLDPDTLDEVFDHPQQRETLRKIAQYVAELRACSQTRDFVELQRRLLHDAHRVDSRRAECVQSAKRVQAGRTPHSNVARPHVGDIDDRLAWQKEALVYERLFRQFRSIGDALAWRVFAYDRTTIAALASNPSPGGLVKRAGPLEDDTGGLPFEVQAVEEAWSERGRLALHHDLTNCLRIGDLTEVESPGSFLLGEVKANPRNRSSAQRARMRSAVSAIESGTPLPGKAGRTVHELSEPYETDLKALMDLVDLTRTHGAKGARLSDGRALMVTNFGALHRATEGDLENGKSRVDAARRSALRRANIDHDTHHLRALSSDLAARAPLLPPWAIYPLRPDECAGLICDAIVFEVVISVDVLIALLRDEGLIVEASSEQRTRTSTSPSPSCASGVPGDSSTSTPTRCTARYSNYSDRTVGHEAPPNSFDPAHSAGMSCTATPTTMSPGSLGSWPTLPDFHLPEAPICVAMTDSPASRSALQVMRHGRQVWVASSTSESDPQRGFGVNSPKRA